MGKDYLTYAHLLGPLSLTMFVISILNLVISYYIALRRYQISGIVILGAATTGYLLNVSHNTLDAIVNSLLLGSISMLGMLMFWRLIFALNIRKSNAKS
jgi:hypothetical protein